MTGHEENERESPESSRDVAADLQREHDVMADVICARLLDGSLPPDEAYWWTRILAEGAIARLAELSDSRRSGVTCRDCGCTADTAQAA